MSFESWDRVSWRSRHTPDVLLVLPSTQKCPCIHGPVHNTSVWPRVAPYLPAAHGAGVEVPGEHAKPTGQISHCAPEERLFALVNVPAAHAMAAGVPSGH
eukprot:7375944-Prymnesium_polylepis.2